MRQAYLGDGLYAEHDGFMLRLYTSNGFEVTNEVFLEPSILKALQFFLSPEPANLRGLDE